jgi:hypothetical protein
MMFKVKYAEIYACIFDKLVFAPNFGEVACFCPKCWGFYSMTFCPFQCNACIGHLSWSNVGIVKCELEVDVGVGLHDTLFGSLSQFF